MNEILAQRNRQCQAKVLPQGANLQEPDTAIATDKKMISRARFGCADHYFVAERSCIGRRAFAAMAAGGLIPLLWRLKHRRARPEQRPQCASHPNPSCVWRESHSGPLCPSRPRAFAQRPYASAELRI